MNNKKEIVDNLTEWFKAWDSYNIDGVMKLLHNDVLFDNWTGGKINGKDELRKAWSPWFENHGNFKFIYKDLFVDEEADKALFQWELKWPSIEKGFTGKPEIRRGVDVMHFEDGKIIKKLTFSKTTIEIDGERQRAKY